MAAEAAKTAKTGDRTFFNETARKRVTAMVKEIEAQTSAEVVVAVRNGSGSYRDVDYLFGFGTSFAALLLLLFHPYEFATEGMPLEVLAAFALGSVLCAKAPPLRRALLPRKRKDRACRDAARAAFIELGVGRTRDRNGILVLVSLFERRVALVADVGIEPEKWGAESRGAWGARVVALESCIARGARVDRFVEAMGALGPVLGAAMPRRPDDVNELPDEPRESPAGDEGAG